MTRRHVTYSKGRAVVDSNYDKCRYNSSSLKHYMLKFVDNIVSESRTNSERARKVEDIVYEMNSTVSNVLLRARPGLLHS